MTSSSTRRISRSIGELHLHTGPENRSRRLKEADQEHTPHRTAVPLVLVRISRTSGTLRERSLHAAVGHDGRLGARLSIADGETGERRPTQSMSSRWVKGRAICKTRETINRSEGKALEAEARWLMAGMGRQLREAGCREWALHLGGERQTSHFLTASWKKDWELHDAGHGRAAQSVLAIGEDVMTKGTHKGNYGCFQCIFAHPTIRLLNEM